MRKRPQRRVVYDLGAPCTDEDQLVKSFLKNRSRVAAKAIVMPPPGLYRAVLRDAGRAPKGVPASEGVHEALLDVILEDEGCGRLVLSNPIAP